MRRANRWSSRGRLYPESACFPNFRLDFGMHTAVDVESELETVASADLALTALVRTADDHDLVLEGNQYACSAEAVRWGLRTSLRTGMLRAAVSRQFSSHPRLRRPVPAHVVLLAELLAQGRLQPSEKAVGASSQCSGPLTDMMTRRTLEGASK